MTARLRLDDARRDAIWPAFRDAWIVYEDDDLIAVDKPDGVSCQAADPEHPDDLVHRLGLHRPGQYLGTHQRLDQATSGVLVYTKRREVNPHVARLFEAREVDKTYLAVVERWRGGARRLEHFLAKGDGGRMRVSTAKDRRAKRAVTHARPLSGDGPVLLEVRIETGRTHQIRAQLAHEGAPVLGDARYGGEPAERLMLHSWRLSFDHPTRSGELTVEAPAPACFEAALRSEPSPLEARLARAVRRRWGLAHRPDLDALRLVHRDGDAVEGLAVDLYGAHAVVHVYADDAPVERVLDWLEGHGLAAYVKLRPRQANVIVDGRDEAYAPGAPARGEPAPDVGVIHEHDLRLTVRLGEGLSTGVFLDQRDARRWVREHAGGRRVLNLFAYTGAFSAAAAVGGAAQTLSVDASGRVLDWARDNLVQAGADDARHALERADCFDALDALAAGGERFDLVIVDPPTYSTTKRSRWKSGNAWRDLGARCLRVLAPGGQLLASSNDQRMTQARFRKHLHDAARDAGVQLAQLKDLRPPADFPAGPGGGHLKSLLATARSRRARG